MFKSDNKRWVHICSKQLSFFLLGLFSGSICLEGLIIGRNFAFENGLEFDSLISYENSPKTT